MNDFPTEIIDAIIKCTDLETRFNLALVNHKLYDIVKRYLNPELKYLHNGKILCKDWSCARACVERRVLYHDDTSQHIWYDSWYNKYGQLDRKSKPAETKWYSSGKKARETWCKNNKIHREKFPAMTTWYENGNKSAELWYENDTTLRENYWYEDGIENHNSYNKPKRI